MFQSIYKEATDCNQTSFFWFFFHSEAQSENFTMKLERKTIYPGENNMRNEPIFKLFSRRWWKDQLQEEADHQTYYSHEKSKGKGEARVTFLASSSLQKFLLVRKAMSSEEISVRVMLQTW